MFMGVFGHELFWGFADVHDAQTVLAAGQQWVAN
jgi:hypothetical protein